MSSEDLRKLAEEPPLTITMVNTTRLATYSTERYYMLSELEQNASSVEFVCDHGGSAGIGGPQQHVPLQAQAQNGEEEKAPQSPSPTRSSSLPPYVLLYLLWRPNTYPSPRSFVEGPVLDNVRRILELGGDEEHVSKLFDGGGGGSSTNSSPSTSPTTPSKPLFSFGGNGSIAAAPAATRRASFGRRASYRDNSTGKTVTVDARTKLYVCIDRISPPSSAAAEGGHGLGLGLDSTGIISEDTTKENGDDTNGDPLHSSEYSDIHSLRSADEQARRQRQHAVETQIAEAVAKTISTHPILRGVVEGVSVGTTAEVRAAPALEVCLKAITHGSGERRRQGRALQRRQMTDIARGHSSNGSYVQVDPMRSPICLMAPDPDDLVGLDPEEDADAVKGAIQSITVAEWNGNGDAVCFASRAMEEWRKRNGLENEAATPGSPSRMTSARKRARQRLTKRSNKYDDGEAEDIAQTMVVAFVIAALAFLWTKYRESIWNNLFEAIQGIYGK